MAAMCSQEIRSPAWQIIRRWFSTASTQSNTQHWPKRRATGIEISGNDGTASKYGVQVAWNYAPSDQQLTFQCLKTPFFVSAADVETKIRALVAETLAV
jgi:hypothetical protein